MTVLIFLLLALGAFFGLSTDFGVSSDYYANLPPIVKPFKTPAPGMLGEPSRSNYVESNSLTLTVSFIGEDPVDAYAVLVFADGTYFSVKLDDRGLMREGTTFDPATRAPYSTIGTMSAPGVIVPFLSNWTVTRGRFVILRVPSIPEDWPSGPAGWFVGLTKPGEKPFAPTDPICLQYIPITFLTASKTNDYSDMVLIDGGVFKMGASGDISEFDPDRDTDNDTPLADEINDADPADDKIDDKETTVNPFFIDKYEVTNSQYAAFLTATQDETRWVADMEIERSLVDGKLVFQPTANKGAYPVRFVTLADAKAFAEWAGKRLPTETEWEFVAAGKDRRTYPWGAEQPSPAHGFFQVQPLYLAETHPVWWYIVGRTPDNKVYGLGGNVYELTSDFYSYIKWNVSTSFRKTHPQEEWGDPITVTGPAVRGGSYLSSADSLKTYRRYCVDGETRYPDVGFRCAKDFNPQ